MAIILKCLAWWKWCEKNHHWTESQYTLEEEKKTYEWTKGHESWLKIDPETEVDKSKEYTPSGSPWSSHWKIYEKNTHTKPTTQQYSAWQREMITHNLLNV